MSDFYSQPPYSQQQQQQQQQQGQQSSSYYGNTTSNTNANNPNESSPYGQSTSEQFQTTAGQDSAWQPSSFANSPSTSSETNNQNFQYQSFQQPQQNQDQNQNQNQNQQPKTDAVPKFWNPASVAKVASATMSGNNDEILAMGIGQAKNFLDEGIARMIPGLNSSMMCLRVYFAVNNSYVKRKMGIVLLSFFNREWRRTTQDPSDISGSKYSLPHSDDNALDLYLPSMSLITYVLLCALCYGTAGKFSPEVLPDIITSCIITQIVEIVVFRIGFYTMQAPVAMLDLLSITGYKYLGLCMNMLVGVTLEVLMEVGSRKGYFVMFMWTASAVSYFVLKTMAGFVPEITYNKGPKREVMIFAFGVSQFVSMWFLGQTKFLK